MDIYDILSAVSILLALIGAVLMLRLVVRHRTARWVYAIVAAACLYFTSLYAYILLAAPEISIRTAGLGRAGIIAILASIIMLALITDK
jgi:hypothetical protein